MYRETVLKNQATLDIHRAYLINANTEKLSHETRQCFHKAPFIKQS